jgi:hypothetical protein
LRSIAGGAANTTPISPKTSPRSMPTSRRPGRS